MSAIDILMAITVAGLWGLNFVGAKFSLDHFPMYYWLFLRFAICAAILIPFCRKPPAPITKLFIAGTTFSVLNSALRFKGIEMGLDVSIVVILDKLSAVFSVLLGVICFKEQIRWRTSIGITVAMIGTIFLSASHTSSAAQLVPFIVVVIGSFFWAVYNVQIKRLKAQSHVSLLAWCCLMGCIVPAILSLTFEKNHIQILMSAPASAWGGLIFVSIGALLAGHLMWYYLLNKYQISQVVPFSLLEPILATIFSSVLLKEHITANTLIGFLITFSGVVIIVFRRPQHASRIR